MPKASSLQVTPLRGMDERWKPRELNHAITARDITWDRRDGLRNSGGFREIIPDIGGANPFAGQGEILSLHWFAQHNAAKQWLIWEDSNRRLRAYNGSNGAATPWENLEDLDGNAWDGSTLKRTVISTPWQRTQSQAWGGRLYLINGYDQPIVFDGIKTERAGFDGPPGAPEGTVLDEGGTTLDELGVGSLDASADGSGGRFAYRYAVTFLNERGQESPLSVSSTLVVGQNADIARKFINVELPLGPSHVTGRRLYRTANIVDSEDGEFLDTEDGSSFYYHSDFLDNSVDRFEDGIPDAGLGSLVDPLDLGPWPISAKYLASFKGTMFIAGMTNNELRFSAPGQPEVYPDDNVIQIGDDDMGPIMGMYPTKNALIVFKMRGIYLVRGPTFRADTLTKDTGCAAPNSICELPGLGIVFLSDTGVWLLEGALVGEGTTGVMELSIPIPDRIRRLNRSALLNSFGRVYHRDKEYWLSVPTLGSADPTEVLVYHYEIGEWTFRENFPISCMVETRDHRGYLLFGSHNTATHMEGIHVYSRCWPTKGGVDVEPLYESIPLDLGSVYEHFQPRHVIAYCIGYGDNDLQLNYKQNRSYTSIRPTVQMTDQQDPNLRFGVYGTAKDGTDVGAGKWGTATWAYHRPITVRFDVSAGHKGPIRELSVAFSPAGNRMQIVGWDIEADIGSQKQILPISKLIGPKGR